MLLSLQLPLTGLALRALSSMSRSADTVQNDRMHAGADPTSDELRQRLHERIEVLASPELAIITIHMHVLHSSILLLSHCEHGTAVLKTHGDQSACIRNQAQHMSELFGI